MKKLKTRFMEMNDSTKKAIIISGSIFLIVLIIVFSNLSKSSDNFNNIKKDRNNYLVYSKIEKEDENFSKYVPDINIKSIEIDKVNEDIDNFTNKYLNSDKSSISYDYDINGIILSVVVNIVDCQESNAPKIYYRTYNINLSSREVISDDSLLDFFKIDTKEVSNIIEANFKNYYADLVKQKYYEPTECDYKCFLGHKDIKDYLDDVNYYVKEGNLIAYRPFIIYSVFGDEEYFESKHFEFLLVETKEE